MSENIGNNTQTIAPSGDSVSALEARIKAAEAQPAEISKAVQFVEKNPAPKVQEQTNANPEPPKQDAPVVEKKDGLQQFKDESGEVSAEKLRKANEHLEKSLREKEELIRKNKELLSKFTKTSQEAKTLEKQVPKDGFKVPEGGFDENSRKQFLADLEKDPTRILDYQRELVRQELAEIHAERAMERQEKLFSSRAEELDNLVKSGHSWILTEGLGRFEKVFSEKPFLTQSQTPYIDALKFMDSPKVESEPATAQPASTPILGGGHALPPPSSTPPVTAEQKVKELGNKWREAIRTGDNKKAAEVWAEYETANKALHG